VTTDRRRQAVVDEAITWLKTPFHHAARLKGIGVDCGQFLLAVYENAGVLPHVEPPAYGPAYAVHQKDEWYAELCAALGRKVATPEPGDCALFRLRGQRVLGHGAIVVEWPLLIHAFADAGNVCRGDAATMAELAGRPVRFFSPF
jgi:cell wall-associated NlpC family hydrolase